MKVRKYFSDGSSSTIMGASLIILMMALAGTLANIGVQAIRGEEVQLAADSISDGVAEYMMTGGEDYEDAKEESERLEGLVEKYMGIRLSSVKIDKDKVEDETISVDVTLEGDDPVDTGDGSERSYQIKKHAASSFTGSGLQGLRSAAQWGADSAPYAVYSNSNRTGIGSNGYITSCDCSSFVWLIYRKMGCTAPLWYTGNLSLYFSSISPSQAVAGDIVYCTAEERGRSMGHVKLYLGNNKTIEMSGGNAGIHYDTIDLNNLGVYHFARIKPEYMSQ